MTTTIQQLEDLKEWAQDSTRYERRLAFRGYKDWRKDEDWDDKGPWDIPPKDPFKDSDWEDKIQMAQGGPAQLVQPGPGRQGYKGDDHHSFKPLTTATEKAHYKRQYGKKYNIDDWRSGNFELKEEFTSGKKKVKRDLSQLRGDFRTSLNKYLSRSSELNKLNKRGYISVGQLNTMLGRKDTRETIDGLERALSGKRSSPWLEEIKGVKKWKKSRLGTGSQFQKIEGGGRVFYKMPPKETLKGLKVIIKIKSIYRIFNTEELKVIPLKMFKCFMMMKF